MTGKQLVESFVLLLISTPIIYYALLSFLRKSRVENMCQILWVVWGVCVCILVWKGGVI